MPVKPSTMVRNVNLVPNPTNAALKEFLLYRMALRIPSEYLIDYIRWFKHRILKKRKLLTHDLLSINAVLDKLQSL
jgi:hypothetical protein